MDSGTIFYIIAIVIYFIYTSFIQKKPGSPEANPEKPEGPPQKKTSFEDLLREIRNEQGQRERDLEGTSEPEPVNTASSATEVAEQRETTYVAQQQEAEGAYKNPYRDIKQPLVKLDDQVDLKDGKKILGEVVDVAEEFPGTSKYARLLKNTSSARDAVILTEIFNRKHF
ncbi:hypothetical protein SAMN05192553_11049 [Cyclobacterium xiamenense]|uniref:Uncharacterized protein n=1 Tax=Cyclobacterium xiamenense TaxID=1297121 RepID=A0A1H7BB23_9BACT|nr:hypothetical protein [Cyclobacterium xiamenense]SEJ73477.1 hypothetical protein SAMN05192553_11049 [Cyclobacterium xiamenense]